MVTRIIATVRRDRERMDDTERLMNNVRRLIDNGITDLRFNVSKWRTADEMERLIQDIEKMRCIFQKAHLKIILDLPYPGDKPRIMIPNKGTVKVVKGEKICLQGMDAKASKYDPFTIGVNATQIGELLKNKKFIYYADGIGTFKVDEILDESRVRLVAEDNMELEDRKSIILGNNVVDEGRKEIFTDLVKKIKPDAVALSFIEDVQAINDFRKWVPYQDFELISKIETEKGVENIERIASTSDSIMLGRGDLGLHMDITKLGFVEKQVVQVCKKLNTPIYIATDILSTLEKRALPSRADVIDLTDILSMNPTGIVLTYGLVRCQKIEYASKMIREIEEIILAANR